VSRSSALRQAIEEKFYPFAQGRGFIRGKASSMFTPFHRLRGPTVQVFDIQWEKYGRPCFVVNFGEAPSGGAVFDGQLVPADKLQPAQCRLNGRLQRWRGGSLRTWFQLSKPWSETLRTLRWTYTPDEVVAQLIRSFAELEAWWETKHAGRHVHM
jgi:hypothetical protein